MRALVLLLPAPLRRPGRARAAAPTKDKEAVTFNEIERGFYIGADAGVWCFVSTRRLPPSASPRPFSPGQTVRRSRSACDFGERVVRRASSSAAPPTAPAPTTSAPPAAAASGDFSMLIPGAAVRVNLVGFNDSQDVKRTWLYVRGGAGLRVLLPDRARCPTRSTCWSSPARASSTSPGCATSRSAWRRPDRLHGADPDTFGFAVTPNLRYAF